MCYNRFLEFLMEEDSAADLNAESNSKIVHFLANLVVSGGKEAPSLSPADSFQANRFAQGKSPAMQFEVSNRNKIIINFVELKPSAPLSEDQQPAPVEPGEGGETSTAGESREGKSGSQKKRESGQQKAQPKAKRSFFGKLFSGKKGKSEKQSTAAREAPQPKRARKFENVRVLGSQGEREQLFGEFHRTMYHHFIRKITRLVNKNENSKFAAEICEMNAFLSNSCSNKHLRRALGRALGRARETGAPRKEPEPRSKKEGAIREESFESVRNGDLENWYFDMESLTKIVNCLN